MLSKLKSFIWNVSAVCFLLFMGVAAINYVMDYFEVDLIPDICEQENISKIVSPDGTKVAKLGYINCGATTDYETGVHVVNLKTGVTYRGVLGVRGLHKNIKVKWTSDKHLVFSNFPLNKLTYFNQDNFSGVYFEIEPSMANKQFNRDK
jgi:Family of unknown function (DUF5412)